MEKIKIKTKQKEKTINIYFYKNKKEIGSISKNINTCMVCKKTTVDDVNLGEKHICSECMELLKPSVKTEKAKVVKTEKPRQVESRTRFVKTGYTPSIKLIDAKKYQNLMPENQYITEKSMTVIVDLLVKGVNTPAKIATILDGVKPETIYTYLRRMARVGMVYNVGKMRAGKSARYSQIYKVASALVYTAV